MKLTIISIRLRLPSQPDGFVYSLDHDNAAFDDRRDHLAKRSSIPKAKVAVARELAVIL